MLKVDKQLIIGLIIGGIIFGLVPAFANMAQLNAEYTNIKIKLNNTYIDTGADEPFIVDGRTYVPARYIVEAMGGNVDWDSKNNTVVISSEFNYDILKSIAQNPIIQDPNNNETEFIILLNTLGNAWNSNIFTDDELNKLKATPNAKIAYENTAVYRAYNSIPSYVQSAFSEFWTAEKAQQYPQIEESLKKNFDIVSDKGNDKYYIRPKSIY